VINTMFNSRSDENIESWEYQCLLASFCHPPVLKSDDPLTKLLDVNSKNKPTFNRAQHIKKNNDVLNIFLSSNHLQIVARFLYGLELFTQYNSWFGCPFSNKSILNCIMLFDGSRFAREYKKNMEFLGLYGPSRCYIKERLSSKTYMVYQELVHGLELIYDPNVANNCGSFRNTQPKKQYKSQDDNDQRQSEHKNFIADDQCDHAQHQVSPVAYEVDDVQVIDTTYQTDSLDNPLSIPVVEASLTNTRDVKAKQGKELNRAEINGLTKHGKMGTSTPNRKIYKIKPLTQRKRRRQETEEQEERPKKRVRG